MPVLCDFTVILNEDKIIQPGQELNKTFNTGGRRSNSFAVLMIDVRGLNHADVRVEVNNQTAGTLFHSPGIPSSHWSSQRIVFDSDKLDAGDEDNANRIEIEATDATGIFAVKDIVVFFKQLI